MTIIDDRVIGAAAEVPADSVEIDWRAVEPRVEFQPFKVPVAVAEGLRLLVRRLGLRFGAADLVVAEDRSLVFLEVNPNGEWGWLEQAHGIAISQHLAEALTRGEP